MFTKVAGKSRIAKAGIWNSHRSAIHNSHRHYMIALGMDPIVP